MESALDCSCVQILGAKTAADTTRHACASLEVFLLDCWRPPCWQLSRNARPVYGGTQPVIQSDWITVENTVGGFGLQPFISPTACGSARMVLGSWRGRRAVRDGHRKARRICNQPCQPLCFAPVSVKLGPLPCHIYEDFGLSIFASCRASA